MAVNKVIFNNQIIIDISDSTVTADKLAKDIVAYDKAGNKIVGTHEDDEIDLQEKTVTPTTNQQNVVPDSGYDGLSKVTVLPIPSEYVKPNATKEATTYTPTTSNQTIASGTYLKGNQTIKGDANLVATNIKKGTQIFGVEGTYDNSIEGVSANGDDFLNVTKEFQNMYVQGNQSIYCYGESQKNIYDANDEYLLSVNVDGDDNTSVNAPNLLATNIKKGVTILGVEGTLEAGEDVSEEVAEYTDLNAELEEVINSLPSAGGGGSLENVDITITNNFSTIYLLVTYTTIIDGVSTLKYYIMSTGTVTINAIKNNLVNIILLTYQNTPNVVTDLDYKAETLYGGEFINYYFIVNSNNAITFNNPSSGGYD